MNPRDERTPDRARRSPSVPRSLVQLALTLVVAAALGGLAGPAFAPPALSTPSSLSTPSASSPARAVAPPPDPMAAIVREDLKGFYVDPASTAAQAALLDPRLSPLAATPQAIWFTETTAPPGQAGEQARWLAESAAGARRQLVLVLYAVPGRDCGQHSAGGLDAEAYRGWVAEIARGLAGSRTWVVLEPDAVAALGDCSGQGDRAGLLRTSARVLTRAGVRVYLDAGHARWRSPTEMARRLRLAGIRHAYGFSTNVSNFGSTSAERRYGSLVARALARDGLRGKRFVIDTSRNGAGPAPDNAWCNPLDARVGAAPRLVGRRGLDALLWVKHPGESDGWCNGGPAAGTFWPDGALELLGLP